MALKETLLDSLQRAYQEQVAFIDTLPEAERTASGTPDHWAAKDVVAHHVEWSIRLMDRLDLLSRGEPLPTYQADDHENAGIFAAYQGVSWDELRRLAQETRTRVIQYVWTAADDDLADAELSPWKDGRPLWQHFAGTYVTHVLLHQISYHQEHGRMDRAAELGETLTNLTLPLDDAPDWRGTVIYNQACLLALGGQTETAIGKLGEALALNPGLVEWSREDPDFASIRAEPGYQALYA